MTTQSRSSTAPILVVLGLLSISGCAALENRISIVPQSLASTPRAGLVKLKSIGGCSNTAVDGESLVVVRTDMTGWSGILPGRHTIVTGLKAVSETPLGGAGRLVERFSSVLPQSVTFEAVSGYQYILACEIIGSERWQVVIYDCTEGGRGLLFWDTSKMKLIAKSDTY